MNIKAEHISYNDTENFSKLILDYIQGDEKLQPFYKHPVSIEGIKEAIEKRKSFPTNRKLLVDTLHKHYKSENSTVQQQHNIKQLGNTNCFTITTAHQPNIFTGPLYFIYKILHAIKLCETLKLDMPENHFVPMFYMGSEDADFDELGHVYINANKHQWQTNQTGAVGRMKIDKALIKMLNGFEGEISVHSYGAEIVNKMNACYTEENTIEQATFKFVNILFGEYGLIVLLPDDAEYKRAFVPVVEKELLTQFSSKNVKDTVSKFPAMYKMQPAGRELNLFYLNKNRRDRIVKLDNCFTVKDTDISFTEVEILQQLKSNPERFSPNVVLRPVFQEMLLPNVAFVGGGSEITYWLQLQTVFEESNVSFPVLVMRNSFLFVEKKYAKKAEALGFSIANLFKLNQDLLYELVKRESAVQLSLQKEKQFLHTFYAALKITAGIVDKTLQIHTQVLENQALKKIEALEKKMLRAEKKKFEVQEQQLQKLKSHLFPHNNLQERIENFLPFYAKWGEGYLNAMYINSLGVEQKFVILEEL